MSGKPDDLDAVRTMADTLKSFEAKEQERIIRWVREKLGLSEPSKTSDEKKDDNESEKDKERVGAIDIKTFVTQKNPSSDTQLAATIAYYYALAAPLAQRKDSISADDLRSSCRLIYGTSRIKYPAQTLVNAHNAGLLDKAGGGLYKINTVGENLVAMTLPSSTSTKRPVKKISTKPKVKRAKANKRK
jgi:hypothetical protein